MQKLLTISDADIFPDFVSVEISYDFRLAVKIILFDAENKIALVGKEYRLLPGGGVEGAESLADAAAREAREEVGCSVKIGKEIAVIEEVRAQLHRRQETHFLIAAVVGEKGMPQTTQADEQGNEIGWCSLDEAISLLEKQVAEPPSEDYSSRFHVRAHLAALKELQRAGM